MLRSDSELVKKWPCSNCGKLIPGTHYDLMIHVQEDFEMGITSPVNRKKLEKEKKTQRKLKYEARMRFKREVQKKKADIKRSKDAHIRDHHLYKSLLVENQKLRQILRVRGIDIRKAMQSTKHDAFYQSTRWRELRYDALVKNRSDNGGVNKCCGCGVTGKETMYQVDHIKPRYSHPSLEYDPKNLQVLCADCNIGKGSKL